MIQLNSNTDFTKEVKRRHQLQTEYLGISKIVNIKKPLVSVCVQTYNHEKYIKDCLDSILEQKTNFEFEIILGEDDSQDKTREICIEYANLNQDKIRLFLRDRQTTQLKDKKGNLLRRLNGIFTRMDARGKYIALCEGDDYWTDPLKLQKQVDFLEGNPDYGICFTNGKVKEFNKSYLIYQNQSPDGANYKSFPIPDATTDIENLANGNYIHTPGVLFRNIFLKNEYPKYLQKVTIGDWPLYMSVAKIGKIGFINQDTFCYRVHHGGVYSKVNKTKKYQMTLGQFAPILEENYFSDKVEALIKSYCQRSFNVYLGLCETKEDLKFANDFLNLIANFDLTFFDELIIQATKRKELKVINGYIKFKSEFDKSKDFFKKKIKSAIKKIN